MRPKPLWTGAAMAAPLLFASWGCGEKPTVATTTAEAKVAGKVLIRGKPMKGGKITFNPSNYVRKDTPPRSAPVKEDGTYEITTLQGQNSVTVTGPEVLKEPQLGYGAWSYEVQPGDNTFDIKMPPQ